MATDIGAALRRPCQLGLPDGDLPGSRCQHSFFYSSGRYSKWPERFASLSDVLLKVELPRLLLKNGRGQLLPPVGSTPEAVSCKFEFVSVVFCFRIEMMYSSVEKSPFTELLVQVSHNLMQIMQINKILQSGSASGMLRSCGTCPGPSLHFSAGSKLCRSGIAGDGSVDEHKTVITAILLYYAWFCRDVS